MGWPLSRGCDRRRRDASSSCTFCCLGPNPGSQQTTSAAEAFRVSRSINQGIHKPEVMITFERFVMERFEPNILPTLRFSTARLYRHLSRRHLIPFFGSMRMSEIGAADVQMFLTGVSKRVSPRTVLSLRNRLSKIFATAVLWGYIQKNPVKGAQVPALTDAKKRNTPTPSQFWALFNELSEPYRTYGFAGCLVRNALRRDLWAPLALC